MTDAGAARTAEDGTVYTAGNGRVHTAGNGTARSGRAKGRFRAWRRTRPFWGGFLVVLGGAEMLVTLRAPLPVILHIGPQGLAGYLVPVILLLCGVLLVAHPPQRVFYALISLVLALVSWLTSNLGGFFVGMLLALVGGCLAFAWTPVKSARPARRTETVSTTDSAAGADAGTAPGTDADSAPGTVAAPGTIPGTNAGSGNDITAEQSPFRESAPAPQAEWVGSSRPAPGTTPYPGATSYAGTRPDIGEDRRHRRVTDQT